MSIADGYYDDVEYPGETEPDYDAMYECWRDSCADKLSSALERMHNDFVDDKGSYYYNNSDRFKRDVIAMLELIK